MLVDKRISWHTTRQSVSRKFHGPVDMGTLFTSMYSLPFFILYGDTVSLFRLCLFGEKLADAPTQWSAAITSSDTWALCSSFSICAWFFSYTCLVLLHINSAGATLPPVVATVSLVTSFDVVVIHAIEASAFPCARLFWCITGTFHRCAWLFHLVFLILSTCTTCPTDTCLQGRRDQYLVGGYHPTRALILGNRTNNIA